MTPDFILIYFIVEVQVVELSVGAEALRVTIEGEVDAASVAFDQNRVPVIIIQQTSTRHRRVTPNRAVLITA